jgi:hypothetical protein
MRSDFDPKEAVKGSKLSAREWNQLCGIVREMIRGSGMNAMQDSNGLHIRASHGGGGIGFDAVVVSHARVGGGATGTFVVCSVDKCSDAAGHDRVSEIPYTNGETVDDVLLRSPVDLTNKYVTVVPVEDCGDGYVWRAILTDWSDGLPVGDCSA